MGSPCKASSPSSAKASAQAAPLGAGREAAPLAPGTGGEAAPVAADRVLRVPMQFFARVPLLPNLFT